MALTPARVVHSTAIATIGAHSPPPAPQNASLECTLSSVAASLPVAPQGESVASGTAQRLSLQWGELYVQGTGAPVRVWAAPWEIGQIIPGERIRVRYDDYGKIAWLDSSGAAPDLDRFARFGALRGTVRWVHRTMGEVAVQLADGVRVFRARPEQLAQVLPGHAVSFEWVRVGRVDWWVSPPGCATP